MFQIGNFFVNQDAIEYVPESVARENIVLPLRVTGREIEILMTEQTAATDIIQKLQFILNRDIIPRFADLKTIRKGVNMAYATESRRASAPSSPSQPPGRDVGGH